MARMFKSPGSGKKKVSEIRMYIVTVDRKTGAELKRIEVDPQTLEPMGATKASPPPSANFPRRMT